MLNNDWQFAVLSHRHVFSKDTLYRHIVIVASIVLGKPHAAVITVREGIGGGSALPGKKCVLFAEDHMVARALSRTRAVDVS